MARSPGLRNTRMYRQPVRSYPRKPAINCSSLHDRVLEGTICYNILLLDLIIHR